MPSIEKIKESREFYIYMLQDVEFRKWVLTLIKKDLQSKFL